MKAPTNPGAIVTLRNAAEMIGVSRQGAYHIADRDPGFPPPIDIVGSGSQRQPLFWRRQIEDYVEARAQKAKSEG